MFHNSYYINIFAIANRIGFCFDGAIEEVIEPYLMQQGFVARTPRGRVATPKAWDRVGLKAPASFQQPLFEDDSETP